MTAASPSGDEVPKTWEDAEEKTREFQGLLRKHDGDWQKATDAQLRGEKPDPDDEVGSPNPM
jgi:hypothetical protein